MRPREEGGPSRGSRPAEEMRLRVEPAAGHPAVAKGAARPGRGRGASASAARCSSRSSRSIRPTGSELYNTNNRNTPDGLANLPRDYTGLPKPAPQLGPPLPGDLGRPILNAGAPAPGMPTPAPSPEEQRIAQEQEAARTSHLFATTNVRQAAQRPPAPTSAGAPPRRRDRRVKRPDLAGSQARVPQRQHRSPHHEPGPRPDRRPANTFCRRAR